MKRIGLLALIALLFIVALCACSPQASGGSGADITVGVVVTQNFGQELMLDETIEVAAGTSAMEALQQVADVEVAYGGGFVNAINGVRSKYPTHEDWFFYVNGLATNRGAADYRLRDGDIEHFDFHDWSFHIGVPAIIGDFPEPFLHGYRGQVHPTVIVYTDGLREDAETLGSRLVQLGVEGVSVEGVDKLTKEEKKSCNLIILGTMDCELIEELDRVYQRLGFFVHFDDGEMKVLNAKGKVEAEYGTGCGVIQATQSPWNPDGVGACENVVWVVSGTNEAGVRMAASAVVNQHAEFGYACAVVIVNGEIIRVPR